MTLVSHVLGSLARLRFLGRTMVLGLTFFAGAGILAAQETGRISGKVVRQGGAPVSEVAVIVDDSGLEPVLTDRKGRFVIERVPPGIYTLTFVVVDISTTETGVEVVAGETTDMETLLDWAYSVSDTLTVMAVSLRRERFVEAPATVTVLTEDEIQRQAAGGQLPKLLEFTPGVELAQSGQYWFNLNVRGFNSTLNRRLLVLIDGRDPSVTYLGSQEWAAVSFPLDDLESAELVHGAGSALYGADSYNGTLVLTTKDPRNSQGGTVRLALGELSTKKLDLRYATELGRGWYAKVVGGYHESGNFTRARTDGVEYSTPCELLGDSNCIPLEDLVPPRDSVEIAFGGLRFDKEWDSTKMILEAGTAEIEGVTLASPVGRLELVETKRPWWRADLSGTNWQVTVNQTSRDANDATLLFTAPPIFLESTRTHVEARAQTLFANERGFVVAGASYRDERLDSVDPQGAQTLVFEPADGNYTGVFTQIEYEFSDELKGVAALRWDDSSLHDARVSPRASLVYSVTPNQNLRLSYNEAFQTPAFSEFFVFVPLAAPLPLQPFEAFCAGTGVSCGFDQPVPILGVGNKSLVPEEVTSVELGYTGNIGHNVFVNLSVYDNQSKRFITDLINFINPELGGRINPNFAPYTPPPGLPAAQSTALLAGLEAALGPFFSLLSNDKNGNPIIPFLSYTNFGTVDAKGLDLVLTGRLSNEWSVNLGYSHSDFDVRDQLEVDPIVPNSATDRYTLGVAYVGERLDAALRFRHSDGFDWSTGVFTGPVLPYDVVGLVANYQVRDNLRVGVDVNNILDDKHYEIFGGDLLTRVALAHLTFSW